MNKLLRLIILLGLILGMGFVPNGGSCKRPFPWQKQHCEEMEQAILDATVRIVFHGWLELDDGYEVERIKGTISHATVVDGRYLLTHNHFGIPLSRIQTYSRHANGGFTGVSVYRLDGTAVLDHAPLDAFVVAEESGETVMLDFGTVAGVGFFANAAVPSAEMVDSGAQQLGWGTELAQIDWNGQDQTRIIWVKVKRVSLINGVPLAQVDHVIELGASGGGVFWNGRHVGNNWGNLVETNLDTGAVSKQHSLVALNS